jgi:hypothetical protein
MGWTKEVDSGGILRPITPSDTAVVHNCKALRVNAAGVLNLQWGAAAVVSLNVVAAETLNVASPFKVRATGTTATVHGLFER